MCPNGDGFLDQALTPAPRSPRTGQGSSDVLLAPPTTSTPGVTIGPKSPPDAHTDARRHEEHTHPHAQGREGEGIPRSGWLDARLGIHLARRASSIQRARTLRAASCSKATCSSEAAVRTLSSRRQPARRPVSVNVLCRRRSEGATSLESPGSRSHSRGELPAHDPAALSRTEDKPPRLTPILMSHRPEISRGRGAASEAARNRALRW
jgi:hypothetical protein